MKRVLLSILALTCASDVHGQDNAGLFESRVRPLLQAHCQRCHGADKLRGGFDVRSTEAILRGGKTGKVVVPGQPDRSLLLRLVAADGDPHMPPGKQLTAPEIADLTRWVETLKPLAADARGAQHWAFRKPGPVMPPHVKNDDWVKTPVDAFILARLEDAKLSPSPPASRSELVRRLHYDLVGLPPSPNELQAAERDLAADLYEKIVDRLLASHHKPELTRWDGRAIPVYRREDAFMGRSNGTALASPYRFRRHGRSGIEMAETYPNLARCADELCLIRSMHCDSNNHGPALFQMQSGSIQAGHASMGSWINYGLGSESENLPGFVVLMDHQGAPVNGALNWSNGFIPASYQGVPFRATGEPIAYLRPPAGTTREQQEARLDLLRRWNSEHAAANPAETSLSARIAAYELAFRMQTHAAQATDLASESAAARRLYGLENPVSQTFGRNCLLARRLVERGVRFVQIYSGGNDGPSAWDAHDNLKANHDLHCAETDQPIAGLLADLRQRGLLDSTLVIWGGEFGRSPVAEARGGRDHHAKAFTVWLAGGGVKGGTVHGATDEFGYNVVDKPVAVPDLHATVLHLLGLDHTRLTYPFQGRQTRLTDVSGEVIEDILA